MTVRYRCPCQPNDDDNTGPPGTHQHVHHNEIYIRIGTGSEAIHAPAAVAVDLQEEA